MNLPEFLEKHRPLYPDRVIPPEHVLILEAIADDLGLFRPRPVSQVSTSCLALISRFAADEKKNAEKTNSALGGGEQEVRTVDPDSTESTGNSDKESGDEAKDGLVRALERVTRGVVALLGGAPTTQNQFDALVSFACQNGLTELGASELLQKHRSGEYSAAAAEFGKWNRIGDKKRIRRWLVIRRAAESALYQGKQVEGS